MPLNPSAGSPPPPPPPTCISIILCEAVHRIADSGNLIIVNTFHTLGVPAVPCRFPKITVLSTITGAHGDYTTGTRVVHAATGETLMEARDRDRFPDPLTLIDTQTILYEVPFPTTGKYWLELRANDELIGQRPFFVQIKQRRKA